MIDFDNTIGKSFTQDFCAILEYHLSRALQNMNTNKFEHFWCDGVEVPEAWNQATDGIKDSRQIITGAWLGVTGQDKYQMIIKLGDKSFERCIKGTAINDCLPDDRSLDWVDIDSINKVISLQLL